MSLERAWRQSLKNNPPTPPKPARRLSAPEIVFWVSVGIFGLARLTGVFIHPVAILALVSILYIVLAVLLRKKGGKPKGKAK